MFTYFRGVRYIFVVNDYIYCVEAKGKSSKGLNDDRPQRLSLTGLARIEEGKAKNALSDCWVETEPNEQMDVRYAEQEHCSNVTLRKP